MYCSVNQLVLDITEDTYLLQMFLMIYMQIFRRNTLPLFFQHIFPFAHQLLDFFLWNSKTKPCYVLSRVIFIAEQVSEL